MKIIKKVFCIAVIGLLGMVSVNAQTNLLKNGDFKNGKDGWMFNEFTLTTEDGHNCAMSPNLAPALMFARWPFIKTMQEVSMEPEKTYIFSFWVKGGLSLVDVNASLELYRADGSLIEDIEEIDDFYWDTNTMSFDSTEDKGNGWVKISREIVFPASSKVVKIQGYKLNLIGNGKANMRITNVSIAEKVDYVAPQNFKVADNMLFQREAKLTWDALSDRDYKVEVGGKTYNVSAGNNSVYVQGLMPGTEYKAVVYSTTETDMKSNLTFTTKDRLQAKEEHCVPFLANIKDNQIPKKFICNILELTGNKITKVEITYNGTPAEITENGMVTLPDFDEGKLVVKIMQEDNKETILTYDSITIKK